MRERKDLTGQRFGKLLVISYDENKKKNYCQCDCGNTTYVNNSNLLSGNTKSCGCGRNLKKTKKKNITKKKKIILIKKTTDINIGDRFSNLVVIQKLENKIYKTEKSTSSVPMFLCQCDCGNICEVQARYLRNGKTKSCGCLKSQNFYKKKYKNKKYIITEIDKELNKVFKKWQRKFKYPTKIFKKKVIDKNIKFFPEMENNKFLYFKQWSLSNGFNIKNGYIYLDRYNYQNDFSNNNCFWSKTKTKRILIKNI